MPEDLCQPECEPLPVPRGRLWCLAGIVLLLQCAAFVPYNYEDIWDYSVLSLAMDYGISSDEQEASVLLLATLLPLLANGVAAMLCAMLASAPSTEYVPRGSGMLSALVLCVLAAWAIFIPLVSILFPNSFSLYDPLGLLLAPGLALLAAPVLVFRRTGNERAAAAIATAGIMQLGHPAYILLFDTLWEDVWSFYLVIPALAVAQLALATSVNFTYWRQKRRENSFRQRLKEYA